MLLFFHPSFIIQVTGNNLQYSHTSPSLLLWNVVVVLVNGMD